VNQALPGQPVTIELMGLSSEVTSISSSVAAKENGFEVDELLRKAPEVGDKFTSLITRGLTMPLENLEDVLGFSKVMTELIEQNYATLPHIWTITEDIKRANYYSGLSLEDDYI